MRSYLLAAREVAYLLAQGVSGAALEADRHWQYIHDNGLDSLFAGYAVSLDMYARACLKDLAKLGNLISVLLVAEVHLAGGVAAAAAAAMHWRCWCCWVWM